jgi:hypothetical protein
VIVGSKPLDYSVFVPAVNMLHNRNVFKVVVFTDVICIDFCFTLVMVYTCTHEHVYTFIQIG